MTRTESPAASQRHERMTLWMQGCLLVSCIAMVAVAGLSAKLYCASAQAPLKVVPERINPNTAPLAGLVRLPGIGRARALDIIHFRQANVGDEPVFKTARDLEQISGIGPKTAEKLAPWLIFETQKTKHYNKELSENGRLGN